MKCWICGKEATETRVIHAKYGTVMNVPCSEYVRCYCSECRKAVEEKEKNDREIYVKLKKREMFLKAVSKLEAQKTNMYEYKEAIEVVEDFLNQNIDRFDSSYEILAAIVLVQNRIYSKTQYKIGPYQVDFLLPDQKVVLEIDGERHKHRKSYDRNRDLYIEKELGTDWNILHIGTELLDMNAKKLPSAIDKAIKYRTTGIFQT